MNLDQWDDACQRVADAIKAGRIVTLAYVGEKPHKTRRVHRLRFYRGKVRAQIDGAEGLI